MVNFENLPDRVRPDAATQSSGGLPQGDESTQSDAPPQTELGQITDVYLLRCGQVYNQYARDNEKPRISLSNGTHSKIIADMAVRVIEASSSASLEVPATERDERVGAILREATEQAGIMATQVTQLQQKRDALTSAFDGLVKTFDGLCESISDLNKDVARKYVDISDMKVLVETIKTRNQFGHDLNSIHLPRLRHHTKRPRTDEAENTAVAEHLGQTTGDDKHRDDASQEKDI